MTAVPIDVRVIRKDGKPIADLGREDFSVLEDGAAQTVARFTASTLVAQAPCAGLRARPETPAFTAASSTEPQDYRVFLIVLGARGLGDIRRHPETGDALLDFVRYRLLPQDQVALLAGNRASDFTTDHETVARLLKGFGLTGLATTATPGPGSSNVVGGVLAAEKGPASSGPPPSIETDLEFADYVRARGKEPLDELERLSYGINYLRFMEGERHLAYVTEHGFDLPSWDGSNGIWNFREIENWQYMKQLTCAGNDARVALNTILTGERVIDTPIPRDMPAVPVSGEKPVTTDPESRVPALVGPVGRQPAKVAGDSVGFFDLLRSQKFFVGLSPPAAAAGVFVDYDLRQSAERTGGQSSMYGDPGTALLRIDDATRTHYLLACYRSNGNWDGRLRTNAVTVNRPDVTVLFRHGYTAAPEIEAFDRHRVIADSRIEAAGHQSNEIRDIDVKPGPSFAISAAGRNGEVVVAACPPPGAGLLSAARCQHADDRPFHRPLRHPRETRRGRHGGGLPDARPAPGPPGGPFIFSFGSVLYEILAGHRAFQGEITASTLAAVINKNPAAPSVRGEPLPAEVERSVMRCLRKDPQRLWQSMSDLKIVFRT